MSNSGILVYAELLANIRQISVIASLGTPCNQSTKVQLSSNGLHIKLEHEGIASALDLPGPVPCNFQLQKPLLGSKEISWRLPISGQAVRGDAEGNQPPWSAASLSENAEFECRSCASVVVKKETINSWRDLPSENWAEMMDFWHCHKPSEHESDGSNGHSHAEDPNASRAYGANTKFTAQSGVGFVDLTTLLLARADCTSIDLQPFQDESAEDQTLVCANCQAYIGRQDQRAEGYRLYKWRLKASNDEPSVASIIAAQLQSIMLAQCSSRLLLIPMSWKSWTQKADPSSTEANGSESHGPTFLHLWILSPTIRYSSTMKDKIRSLSTGPPRPSGQLAMKVFWKVVPATTAEKLMDTNGVEEIPLPMEAIVELKIILQRSALVLPQSGRIFQDWDVGLLDRFEEVT